MSDNTSGGASAGQKNVGQSQAPDSPSYVFPISSRSTGGSGQATAGGLSLKRVSRQLRSRLIWQGIRPAQASRTSLGFVGTLNSVLDLCVMLISISVATMLSHRPIGISFPEFIFTTFVAGGILVASGAVLRHYDSRAYEREVVEDASLVSILVMAVAIFLQVLNVVLGETAAIPKVPQFLLVFWPGVLFLRLFVFRNLAEGQPASASEVLIVGIGPLGRTTGEELEKRGRYRVVGYLRFQDESRPAPLGSRLIGLSNELERVLRTTRVTKVYLAGDVVKNAEAIQAAIRVCETFGMPFALPAYGFRFEHAWPVARRAVADGYMHFRSGLKPHQVVVKRLMDIVLSSIALTILLPVFGMLAILIKLSSRGPVLFWQDRAGLYGRPFHLLKFRTMVVNAEQLKELLKKQNERTGPAFKIRNDPRITRVGRFLRKYSVDELPQLINVLRGEMSLVGPRPLPTSEVALQEPWQLRRLAVRPGLTCIWQACANRHEISFEEWMYLDMLYIDHWSLAKDFALIIRTVPTVVGGAGDR
jgi:exopolysaccharide biosynthesis polyprenyl glycosylphosphotransferase